MTHEETKSAIPIGFLRGTAEGQRGAPTLRRRHADAERVTGIDAVGVFRLAMAAAAVGAVLTGVGLFGSVAPVSGSSTFTVNSANDVDDGTCDGAHCSLREAINAANANAGLDTIVFNIAGGGAQTIAPASQLPDITDAVTIDGLSQPCPCITVLRMRLDGAGAGAGADGFHIVTGGAGTTIKGFAVTRFSLDGIDIAGGGANTIVADHVGTGLNGVETGLGNGGRGIYVNGSSGNLLGVAPATATGILVSGNGASGIEIAGAASTGNVIEAAAIGIKRPFAATAPLPNTLDGVFINGAPLNSVRSGVISGNGQNGIHIAGAAASGTVLQANAIGTDYLGSVAQGNANAGVYVEGAPSTSIGLPGGSQGNVISSNGVVGVLIGGAGAIGTTLKASAVGTDVTGMADLGNGGIGIWIVAGASLTRIGGPAVGDGNIISGNDNDGILISSSSNGNVVQGNLIGVNLAGTGALPNAANGVAVTTGSTNNQIGGYTINTGNVISGNPQVGVLLQADSNVVVGNRIGTSASGAGAVPNSTGVSVCNGSNNSIGTTASGGANLISGNFNAGVSIVCVLSSSNAVAGNLIGVQADGVSPLGNGQDGVLIGTLTAGASISTNPVRANVIANNGNDGVRVDVTPGGTANQNRLRENLIYANANLGIQLIGGVGANGDLATPVITGAGQAVTGTACGFCAVEVYSDAGSQGRYYQGTVNADGGGNWNYAGGVVGPHVTATATDAAGNTSPFSAPVSVTVVRVAGTGIAGFSGDSGPASGAQLNQPHGVFETAVKDLYIADTGNNRVRYVTPNAPSGIINTVIGDGTSAVLNGPRDVFVDATGNLFVADTGNCRIQKVTPGPDLVVNGGGGEVVGTVAGTGTCGYSGDGGPATAAQLDQPSGIATDIVGNLYIADTNNNRVRRVDVVTGIITTIAGTGTPGYNGEGTATSALLNQPRDVYVGTPQQFIIIADTLNHRIRRLSGATISTIAGTGTPGYSGDGGLGTLAQINGPEAVAVDAHDNVYFADTQNQRVRNVGFQTGVITTAIGGGAMPPPAEPLDLQLHLPAGYAVGSGTVANSDPTTGNTVDSTPTNIDPTTGQPVPPRGNAATSCRQSMNPLSAVGDLGLVSAVVGMVAGRRRLRRWLIRLRVAFHSFLRVRRLGYRSTPV